MITSRVLETEKKLGQGVTMWCYDFKSDLLICDYNVFGMITGGYNKSLKPCMSTPREDGY